MQKCVQQLENKDITFGCFVQFLGCRLLNNAGNLLTRLLLTEYSSHVFVMTFAFSLFNFSNSHFDCKEKKIRFNN